MRVLAVLLAVGCLTVVAPSAQAGPYRDWMPVFTKAAERYWGHGQPPECGQPIYQWSDQAAFANDDTLADELDCVIRINVDGWHAIPNPTMRCGVVFHELGHAYGHTHAEGGIMAPNAAWWDSMFFKPCTALTDRWLRRYGWML